MPKPKQNQAGVHLVATPGHTFHKANMTYLLLSVADMAEQFLFVFGLIFTLCLMLDKSSGDSGGDENCFKESCGRKYDPNGPLVKCKFL